MENTRRAALRIAMVYGVFAAVWIYFSDRLLLEYFQNAHWLTYYETLKGWGFVLITAGLLYWLMNRELRKRALYEEALRFSENRYRTLLDQAADGIMMADQTGRYTDANGSALKMLGYSLDELRQLRMSDLVHPEDQKATPLRLDELKAGRVLLQERRLRRKDGTYLPVEISGKLLENGILQGIFRDITRRKDNQARLQRQMEQNAALHAITLSINSSIELDQTLEIVLEQTSRLLEVDAAAISLYDDPADSLLVTAVCGFYNPPDLPYALKARSSLAGKAVQERKLIDRASYPELPLSPRQEREGFHSHFAVPLIAQGSVVGVLEVLHRTLLEPSEEWFEMAHALAEPAATAIQNARLFENLEHYSQELAQAYDNTLVAWTRFLELRDRETQGHSRSVTELSLRLARRMGIDGDDLVHMRRGALLHDIGKMGVPDSILLKPGPLTDEEWVVMRQHPVYAYEMLRAIDFLAPALIVPHCHHERWDGSGYPNGLSGTDIPLPARIFAVVDVWDALLSDRPYRRAWPLDKVRRYIVERAGRDFDPQVVGEFMRMLEDSTPEYIR